MCEIRDSRCNRGCRYNPGCGWMRVHASNSCWASSSLCSFQPGPPVPWLPCSRLVGCYFDCLTRCASHRVQRGCWQERQDSTDWIVMSGPPLVHKHCMDDQPWLNLCKRGVVSGGRAYTDPSPQNGRPSLLSARAVFLPTRGTGLGNGQIASAVCCPRWTQSGDGLCYKPCPIASYRRAPREALRAS